MSLHCLQNSMMEKNKANLALKKERNDSALPPRDHNENVQVVPPAQGASENENNDRDDVKDELTSTAGVDDVQQNEFSDQSEEFCFEPLPESVFEAIEDTEDDRPASEENSGAERDQEMEGEDRPDDVVDPQAEDDKRTRKNRKTRTCALCPKKYTASSSYFYHMKYFHRQSKEHECSACGRKFGTRAALAAHSTVHSGERALACKHCDKSFSTRASLYIHAQVHADSASAPAARCDECGRTFRWRASLHRHRARHAAARAHVCATCGRGFSVRSDLARHVRTHAAHALACDTCGATFAQPRYLRVHVQKKHALPAGRPTASSAA